MDTGIRIGTIVEKESLVPMTDAIVRILEAKADQESIRCGLLALERMARVEGVTLRDVTITGDRSITIEADGAAVRHGAPTSAGIRVDGPPASVES